VQASIPILNQWNNIKVLGANYRNIWQSSEGLTQRISIMQLVGLVKAMEQIPKTYLCSNLDNVLNVLIIFLLLLKVLQLVSN